jgi:hypothetical protein
MRLPQSILRSICVCTVHFLTISLALTLFGMAPVSAGAATQQLECTPATLRFGANVVGQTETLLVTVTNSGETTVTVSAITATSSEFTTSDVSLPLVITAGQSADLSVSFTPSATGSAGGTIEFSSDASNSTLVLGLKGWGVGSEFLTASPSSVSFGQVATGTSSTVPVVLTNDRSRNVTVSALQTTGSGFSMSGPTPPFTLGAGQTVTVNITFAPQAAGTDGGSLFVSGPALAIPLSGTGAATQYSVNLFWNPSSDVAGYNVYRGASASGTFSKINSTLDSNTAYTDSTVVAGQTYYYAATSVNSSGQESTLSTPPVQAVVP